MLPHPTQTTASTSTTRPATAYCSLPIRTRASDEVGPSPRWCCAELANPPAPPLPSSKPAPTSKNIKKTTDPNATAHCSVPMLKKYPGDEEEDGAELANPLSLLLCAVAFLLYNRVHTCLCMLQAARKKPTLFGRSPSQLDGRGRHGTTPLVMVSPGEFYDEPTCVPAFWSFGVLELKAVSQENSAAARDQSARCHFSYYATPQKRKCLIMLRAAAGTRLGRASRFSAGSETSRCVLWPRR